MEQKHNPDSAPVGYPPELPASSLEHLPISVFGMSMGVLGLALALRAGGFAVAATLTGGLGAVLLLFLYATYGLKSVRFPRAVVAEWAHPVRLAFFPAANISLLLIVTLLREDAPALARPLWLIGAAVQAGLTVVVISAWISSRAFGPAQLSPAWFIPAVANALLPLAGVTLGYVEASWYFFSVGMLFWFVLLTLVFNRLIFHFR